MNGGNRNSEDTFWSWLVDVLFLSIFALYLPLLIVVVEKLLFRSSRAYELMNAVGVVKALAPVYKATIVRLLQ